MINQGNEPSQMNLSRACVFIDSSNPSMPYQVIDNKIRPSIKIPFPPVIDAADLIVQQSNGNNGNNVPTRAPNAFIIYRKAFINAARSDGYHLPMRIMSSMASQSWESESDMVKSEYRRLANEAFNLRNEMYPKSGCRRKRSKWNIVSFKNKNKTIKKRQKWNIVSFDTEKSDLTQNKSEQDDRQLSPDVSSPTQSQTSTSQNESNKEDCPSNVNNNNFSLSEINFDTSKNVFNENFGYQNMIQSPELSITSNSSFSPDLSEQLDIYNHDSFHNSEQLDIYNNGSFYNFEQSLCGIFNQPDEQISFQQIKNDNFYYQNPEFDNIDPIFDRNNINLLNENENVSFKEYINENIDIHSQSADVPYLNDNVNYSWNGLGISNSLGVDYFQNSIIYMQ